MDVDVLSLSYMSVFDSGKVLEELNRSLNELKALVESVEAKYGEAL